MPTVPMYNQRQVQSAALPANGVSVQTSPETFGAGFGELGQRVTGIFAEHQQRANVAMSQDAMLQFQSYADDQLNNPETGLMTKQGKDVIGQADVTLTNIRGKADELMQQLPEGQVRDNFLRQVNASGQQYKNQARTFEIGQVRQYETNQFQGILTSGVQNVSQMYGDNRAYVEGNKQIFEQIDQFGSAHGWSSEQIQAKKVEFKEQAAQQAVQNQLGADYMNFMIQNGEPADTGGSMRAPSGNQSEPRGVRNNNPGNIVATDQKWEGQAGSDGSYAKFVKPEYGIRALGKNLLSYQRQGFDTVEQIISRWAPPHENDTAAYIKAVAGKIGVSPGDKLDLTNIGTLTSLSKAIMQHENGQMKFTDQQIGSGLQAALGINQLPPAESAPKRLTGMAAFEALNAADQGKFMRQAEAIGNQQKAQYRSQLEGVVKDANAAYLRGKEYPNAPGQAEFIQAYGYSDGMKNFNQFRQTQQLGSDIGAVQNLPFASQQALLQDRQPVPGEGYAAAASRYDSLTQAVDYVNRARQSDPVHYAQQQQVLDPVSIGNVQQFGAGLAQRANMMPQISQEYGTPLKVFSKEEAAQLGQVFQEAPVSQQVAYLDTMRQSIGDKRVYMAALQQVSESAPTAAVAGIIMDKPGAITAQTNLFSSDVNVNPSDAAMAILEGNRARKGEKGTKGMPMPKDTDMRADFASYVGDAFAGDAQGAEMAYQTALDYYAGLSQRKGDITGEYDTSRFKQAMGVSTGGIYDYNGQGSVMLPWGMGETEFDSAVDAAWKDQVTGAGIKAPPGQYGLQSYGDSQYLIKLGAGYLQDNTGQPVILNLQRKRQRFIGDIPQ